MRVLRAFVVISAIFLIGSGGAALADTGDPEFRSAGSRQNTILEDPCPANEFPPIQIAFASVIDQRLPGTITGIRCITEVRRGGEPVRGVPVMLGGELFDEEGEVIAALPTRSGTTNRAGQRTFTFPYSVPPPGSFLGVTMEGLLEGDLDVDALDTNCSIIQRQPCNNSSTQACLSGRRFKVEATTDAFGQARLLGASKVEARFAFGSSDSTDLLVQLLQRCTNNDHYWVFASATTSLEYEMTVTDTFNGESRAYSNRGTLEPILDTAAFATCP